MLPLVVPAPGGREGIFILNRNDQEATLEDGEGQSWGGSRGPRVGAELGLLGSYREPSPPCPAAFSGRTT